MKLQLEGVIDNLINLHHLHLKTWRKSVWHSTDFTNRQIRMLSSYEVKELHFFQENMSETGLNDLQFLAQAAIVLPWFSFTGRNSEVGSFSPI